MAQDPSGGGDQPNKKGPFLQKNEDIASVKRALPSSEDAEKGVLSCMLQDYERVVPVAIEKVPGQSVFYVPAHRLIYEAVIELYDQQKPVDLIPITQMLSDRGKLEAIGGPATVAEIFAFVPTAAHFDFYLEILLQKDTLRRIITSCTDCITRAYEDQENVTDLLDEVEQRILEIRDGKSKSTIASMKDHVFQAIDELEATFERGGGMSGLPSGFSKLDEMTSGFRGGEMIVIAARPAMGKTSFLMNIVEHVGVQLGKSVAVFSLEMSTAQLVQRLLCSRAGVDMNKVRSGFLSQKKDFPKLMQAAGVLAESAIFVDDTPGLSIVELRAKARRMKKQADICMVAIDYLQLLKSPSRRAQDNRQLEIAEISAGLKALSKELDVPVLVLAQLNRGPENRTGNKPRLSDLRESGSIEQDADMVAMLWREQYYKDGEDEDEEENGKSELIIAKQRNGPTGEVPLTFISQYTKFVDRAPDYDDD